MKKLMPVVVSGLLLLSLSSCGGHDVVTYAEYKQVRPNMKFTDVERLVGHNGRFINGQTINGAFIATKPDEMVYIWQNKDGSNMSVIVVDGRVVARGAYELE